MTAWWLRLLSFVRLRDRGIAVIVLAIFLDALVVIVRPWPLKVIVDNVLSGQPLAGGLESLQSLPGAGTPEGLLSWMAAASVMVFIASQAIAASRSYAEAGVGRRLIYSLAAHLFGHLQRLSLHFHTSRFTGDLVQRVTSDTSCARDLLLSILLPVLSSLVTLTLMFTVMWALDPSLTLLSLAFTPLLLVLVRRLSRPMKERTYRQRKLEGEMSALAEQTLTAVPVVQAYGREEAEEARYRGIASQTFGAYMSAMAARVKFNLGVSAVTAMSTAVIMAYGGLHVLDGTLTVGGLLVFLSYLVSLFAPLEALANVSMTYASAGAGAQRVLEVMDVEEEVFDADDAASLPLRSGIEGARVAFDNVSFGYEPGRPVLRGVALEVKAGETIAVVGPTGSGKSTLLSLVPRFFDPWEGRVLFEGVDLREIKVADLRSQISMVLQEPFLLPLTVAENIAFGRPESTLEEVISAAVAAGADEFIARLPQRYDTVIGERGITLSGGQKQRLAIARAFLRDAPVLIMDEPTSALDAETEAELVRTLERLKASRTTFIIAHRLSTIRGADRIAVLEDGRIVEIGSHTELLDRNGVYARLYGLQSGSIEEG